MCLSSSLGPSPLLEIAEDKDLEPGGEGLTLSRTWKKESERSEIEVSAGDKSVKPVILA